MRSLTKRFYLLFLFSFFLLLVSSCREKEEKKSISENNETTEWAEKLPDKIDETTEWAEKLPDKIDGNYLQVIECYGYDGHPTYQEAFSDGEFVKNLKCFNEHLHDEYSYFELSFQSAQKIGYYNGDIDFVLDNDKTMFNQKIELNGRRTYVTTLKTVMIDFGISQILEEHIYIWRSFETADYEVTDRKIPVILGSEYAKKYTVGDELELNYLFLNATFTVVGFLKPDTSFTILNQEITLDNYICIPAFEANMKVDSLNKVFLQLFYIQKNKGMILIPDSCSEEEVEEYRKLISESAKEYGLYFDLATLQTDILIE